MAESKDNTTRGSRDEQFVESLTRHKSQLFRFVFAMVHSLPDAEDVFQQAAITMWDKFSEFEPGTDFYAWACSIARFKSLDHLKVKGRRRLLFSDELLELVPQHDHWQPETQQAKLRALAQCRHKLSSKDQELLLMCYNGQESIRKSAESVGRPVGSVYDSLSRIRRALYACIERTLASEGQS